MNSVIVALSGGVDSSVAAFLLKEAGFNVIGISLLLSPDIESSYFSSISGKCCSYEDIRDARIVCDKIGISFYSINLRDAFKEKVLNQFVSYYLTGLTPNPCAQCNHKIKFDDMLRIAISLNAKLATGHYARINCYKGKKTIFRPADASRDQTYYMYGLDSSTLDDLEFPLGNLKKSFVRSLAKKASLPVFNKPDSNEICFVPATGRDSIMKDDLNKIKSGKFLNSDGFEIGSHDGIHLFTIGQRKGTGVCSSKRLFVVDIDPNNGNVVLGPIQDLKCSRLSVKSISGPIGVKLWPKIIKVQIRSQSEPISSLWNFDKNENLILDTLKPVSSVAIGQVAVFYDNHAVLGGGVISGRLNGAFPRFFNGDL